MNVTSKAGCPKGFVFGPRGQCRGQGNEEQDENADEILSISELDEST